MITFEDVKNDSAIATYIKKRMSRWLHWDIQNIALPTSVKQQRQPDIF